MDKEKPSRFNIFGRLKNTLKKYKRVLTVARKPGKDEFLLSLKITGGGIIFMGLIGFLIFLIYFLVIR